MTETEPQVQIVSEGKLLLQKVGMAFVIGFLAYFLPAVLDIVDTIKNGNDIEIGWALVVSLVTGGVGAGVRYVLAKSPLNLVTSDKIHSIGSPPPVEVIAVKDTEGAIGRYGGGRIPEPAPAANRPASSGGAKRRRSR